MRKALCCMVMAVGLLSACQPRSECFGSYQTLPLKGWALGDTVSFRVPAAEGERPCRLDLCLRTIPDYPKTGVMLMVRTEQRRSEKDSTDVPDALPVTRRVAFPLGDSLNHRTGRGIALLQYRRPFLQLSLNRGDTLLVDIWPDVATGDTLSGLSDVGVMLSEE